MGGKMKSQAYWFSSREKNGFPVERAALGLCDLSIMHIGGEWQWLVQQFGQDVAEGGAITADEAKRQAEEAALSRFPDPGP
jgi:hypothetical protein